MLILECNNEDVGRPEQDLFLLEAADHMKEYHMKHGEYAKEWHEIKFPFSNGPASITDPNLYPCKENGNKWRPMHCQYIYYIKESHNENFIIEALSAQGKPEYEIRPGMVKPRKL